MEHLDPANFWPLFWAIVGVRATHILWYLALEFLNPRS